VSVEFGDIILKSMARSENLYPDENFLPLDKFGPLLEESILY
jgi:hypothetical protein